MSSHHCRTLHLSPDGLSTADKREIADAAAGGVIVYPTDTFYGLGTDPFSDTGVARIYELKQRPASEPLLVLLERTELVERFAAAPTALHQRLMERYWPGPLTLLFPARPGLPGSIVSGEGQVALRVPGSSLCRQVIAAAGGALTGTSANRSGEEPAPALAAIAPQVIAGSDLVIDAGTLPPSKVSTIVRLCGGGATALREGVVNLREIEDFIRSERG